MTKTIEPTEYFKALKAKVELSDESFLKSQYSYLISEIESASAIKQQAFVDRILFNIVVIDKEIRLLETQFTKYVRVDALKELVDKVEPKNSIKIIELERYPRIIPDSVKKNIEAAQELGIFDKYCVVFTDLTDNDYKTDSEKEFVRRNRDPIVFGYFSSEELESNYEKFYFIDDWEDELCDLTLDKALEKMSELGIHNASGELADVDSIIKQYSSVIASEESNKSFFKRLLAFFKGGKE